MIKWTEIVGALAAVVAAAGAVGTFIFLGLQLNALAQETQLVAKTNRAILYQNITIEMQRISRIFLRCPELRRYFYSGAEPPSPDSNLGQQVQTLAEIFVDFMGFTLNTNVLFSEEERAGWTSYFEHVSQNSPAVQDFWRQNGTWYESPVKRVLDKVVPAIDNSQVVEAQSTQPSDHNSRLAQHARLGDASDR